MDILGQISNLNKDERVIETLIKLERCLGVGSFRIVDHWEADSSAIGICHPDDSHILAYIAPNALDARYYVELEAAPVPESEMPCAVAGQFSDVTFNELVDLVSGHLKSVDR